MGGLTTSVFFLISIFMTLQDFPVLFCKIIFYLSVCVCLSVCLSACLYLYQLTLSRPGEGGGGGGAFGAHANFEDS